MKHLPPYLKIQKNTESIYVNIFETIFEMKEVVQYFRNLLINKKQPTSYPKPQL